MEIFDRSRRNIEFITAEFNDTSFGKYAKLAAADEILTRVCEERHQHLMFSPEDGYIRERSYSMAFPEKELNGIFRDDKNEAYDAAVRLEQFRHVENALLLYYFAARMGSRNAMSAISNMSNQNTKYFIHLEQRREN